MITPIISIKPQIVGGKSELNNLLKLRILISYVAKLEKKNFFNVCALINLRVRTQTRSGSRQMHGKFQMAIS